MMRKQRSVMPTAATSDAQFGERLFTPKELAERVRSAAVASSSEAEWVRRSQ